MPKPPTLDEQRIWDARKDEVRESFKHAWSGYKVRAFPSDELLPISGGKSDKFNGWGVTVYDSLDTMWIMGLREEFAEAVLSIKDQQFNPDNFASFFETIIRYLGGSLSAYALSKDNTLLHLADQLGTVLLPAFNGTETGLPSYSVNVKTGEINTANGRRTVLFAEATSCQLEFKYLAKLTGKTEYYDRVQKAMDVIYEVNPANGLFADRFYTDNGTAASTHLTAGAMADSGYEYLLKQWLLSGDKQSREQYIKSANGIINNLIHVTPTRGLMNVGDIDTGYDQVLHRLEHLSCFLPGTLALGAAYLDLSPGEKELHQWAAEGLAYTCYVSYADQLSGLGPDLMNMPQGGKKWVGEIGRWKAEGRQGKPPGTSEPRPERDPTHRDYSATNARYLLRPETVESIFYMWRLTGDVKWRDRGYAIFQAIEKYTRTVYGYGSIYGVDSLRPSQMDDMPSFFLAETLKYLYLLFDDVTSTSLNEWVFNTEAHPLPIFSWTPAEKQGFNITI
ncbi:glycoside hydrolase family 47 protein [Hypholoma sublateritium FD-334 SS-4]|uniref:alpha-1,2-Mannosidase n=1 Tax=Hypholoma sublateritium (strain FD-334 SS-4) TaxID=945553 RepID=A0A0D2KLA8_HYPSF|nr:glycoside hydrolase family 47 protein [Hypholoma sublateritium FD-334 SS-4]